MGLLRQRYELHVVRTPDGCWDWTGPVYRFGYGHVSAGGQTAIAHRLSWEIHVGPIPDGMFVLHRCDNPPCTRPEHLFLGTQADNMHDMAAKGRSNMGRMYGESNGFARLTESAVAEIRRRRSEGESLRVLALAFGVLKRTISRVVRGETWRQTA